MKSEIEKLNDLLKELECEKQDEIKKTEDT